MSKFFVCLAVFLFLTLISCVNAEMWGVNIDAYSQNSWVVFSTDQMVEFSNISALLTENNGETWKKVSCFSIFWKTSENCNLLVASLPYFKKDGVISISFVCGPVSVAPKVKYRCAKGNTGTANVSLLSAKTAPPRKIATTWASIKGAGR